MHPLFRRALAWAYAPGPALYLTAVGVLALAFADQGGHGPDINGMGVAPSGQAAYLLYFPLGVLLGAPIVRAWGEVFARFPIYPSRALALPMRLIAGVYTFGGVVFYLQAPTIGTADEVLAWGVPFVVGPLALVPSIVARLRGYGGGPDYVNAARTAWEDVKQGGRRGGGPTPDEEPRQDDTPPPGSDIPDPDDAPPSPGPLPTDYPTACLILSIPESASYEQAQKVYRALAAANHPDLATSPRERMQYEANMVRINAAWEIVEAYHGRR